MPAAFTPNLTYSLWWGWALALLGEWGLGPGVAAVVVLCSCSQPLPWQSHKPWWDVGTVLVP